MSSPAMKKIRKSHRAEATQLEIQIGQVLYDLEQGSKNLKQSLTGFVLNQAKEFEVSATKNCVVIYYPLRFMRKVRKAQKQLVNDLEKKLQKNVIFVASRKIMGDKVPAGGLKAQRSRTMKAVHESYLDDICFPADIVGKRIRQLVDGSKQLKVFIDAKHKERMAARLDTFTTVYNKLTERNVAFGFMSNAALQQVVA